MHAGIRLLSLISCRLRNFAALPIAASELRCYAEFYVGKIPRVRIGDAPLEGAVILKWFYSLSRRKIFIGGKCAVLSVILVVFRKDRSCLNDREVKISPNHR